MQSDRYLIENDTLVYVNIVIASTCLAALLCVGSLYALRTGEANAAAKHWSPRRKRIVTLYSAELVIQIINLAFYLVPNVYVLCIPCSWFFLPIHIFGTIRWSCWSAVSCVRQKHSGPPCFAG
jgi:hypothetical protein